jgi:hypothetical protein
MRVVALRQLYGSYGLAATGEQIEVEADAAKDMLARKMVCLPADYVKQYEKKIVVLSENKSGRRLSRAIRPKLTI